MQAPFQRILVATDYGASAVRALEYARKIANRFGAELHILHVVEDPLPLAYPEGTWVAPENLLPELVKNANTFLCERTKNLQVEPTVEVTRAVTGGYPSQEIQKYAADHNVDLIVLGTRGRYGLSRAVMGSVAEKTVRLSKCPVLSMHAPHSTNSEKPAAATDIRTILVATDFSEPANRARDLALILAKKFESVLHIIHVVPEPLPIPDPKGMWTDPEGMWIRPEYSVPKYVEDASRRLDENVAAIEADAKYPMIQTVKIGYPIDAIEAYANDHNVDLIVLGTQGHRGLAHLLLGSIAEKIVRSASCPVLTTH